MSYWLVGDMGDKDGSIDGLSVSILVGCYMVQYNFPGESYSAK